MLGWIASLIAMRYYELDSEKMAEIQLKIAEIKANNSKDFPDPEDDFDLAG